MHQKREKERREEASFLLFLFGSGGFFGLKPSVGKKEGRKEEGSVQLGHSIRKRREEVLLFFGCKQVDLKKSLKNIIKRILNLLGDICYVILLSFVSVISCLMPKRISFF